MHNPVSGGPAALETAWSYCGSVEEDEDMTRRRLRQANLMGPAGFVSIDDSEGMKFSQAGVGPYPEAAGGMGMGGGGREDEQRMVTESVIPPFYGLYRPVMEALQDVE